MKVSAYEQDKEELIMQVRKAKYGDKEAFCNLIRINKVAIYRIAKSILTKEEDIEDAVSEAILKAYKNIKTLKNDEIEYTDVMRYNPYKDLTINTKTFKEVFGLENFMEYRDKNYVYNKKPIVKIEELEQGYMKISSTEVFNDFVKFICDEFGYKTI